MNRRGFLGRLGAVAAAPLLVNASLVEATPTADLSRFDAPLARFPDGHVFKQIRAHKDFKANDLVCIEDNKVLGVATKPIRAGEIAWIQVGGPVAIRLRHS